MPQTIAKRRRSTPRSTGWLERAAAVKREHERWLLELTAIPTAAGKESRVMAWVRRWVEKRRNLRLREDRAGNLIIQSATTRRRRVHPLYITAHLDHPAFVVCGLGGDDTVELEFRGGVHDPYFENARIDIIDAADHTHPATIAAIDPGAKPFKRVIALLEQATDDIVIGDVGRWRFADDFVPHLDKGVLHTHACDDLAAVAAALAALDVLRQRPGMHHVGVLLTRAEEVGFIGAIACCKLKSVPKSARLICLENSRSFAESPIGAGPILRVGDRISVFDPELTNQIGSMLLEYQKADPAYKWQRKLMPGGACEATTFSAFGHRSTCLCLPLGNYHNMSDIDGALAGRRPARIAPEFISIDDYHGLVKMLLLVADRLDDAGALSISRRMNDLYRDHAFVLDA